MKEWLSNNWKTTAFGMAYIGCNVGAVFFAPIAAVCPFLDKAIIAGGFIAAADAGTVNELSATVTGIVKEFKK